MSVVPSPVDPSCVVVVFGPDQQPVGCGVVVGHGEDVLVLTCAHVVNAALGRERNASDVPAGSVLVAPWFAREEQARAYVTHGGWVPVAGDDSGDIALLVAGGPLASVGAAPLRPWGARPRLSFQCLGFPGGYRREGQHAMGAVLGRFGPRGEWAQLDGQTAHGARITGGFSGTPVWDRSAGTVIGIVVAEDKHGDVTRCGAMLPIETAAGYVPALGKILPATPHPLAEILCHVGPGSDVPLVRDVPATAAGATHTHYSDGPYVGRNGIDEALRRALAERTFILVHGPSAAGKTRTAWEAAQAVCDGHLFVEPKSRSALVALIGADVARLSGSEVLVWLDDFERFIRDQSRPGLDLELLHVAASQSPPWRVLATIREERRDRLFHGHDTRARVAAAIEAWERSVTLRLRAELSGEERVAAALAYPAEQFKSGTSIGAQLIAGVTLVEKLERAENVVGWALAQAAIDWARTGREDPIPLGQLVHLALAYLPDGFPAPAPHSEAMKSAFAWVLDPVASDVSVLTGTNTGETLVFQALDYLVSAADAAGSPVRMEAWVHAATIAGTHELAAVIREAEVKEAWEALAFASRQCIDRMPAPYMPICGASFGRALLELKRPEEAVGILEIVAASDNEPMRAHALESLGDAYRDLGDLREAAAHYRKAIDTSHAHTVQTSQLSLARVLEESGDDEGALEVYATARVAENPAGWSAAVGSASILERQGEPRAAAEVIERLLHTAGEGFPVEYVGWVYAGRLHEEAGDSERAIDAYVAAGESADGDPLRIAEAAWHRGRVLEKEDREEAAAEFRLAVETGAGEFADLAAISLSLLIDDRPERQRLLRHATRSEEMSVAAVARVRLAHDHLIAGETIEALAAARTAAASRARLHSEEAFLLATVLEEAGALEDAAKVFAHAAATQSPDKAVESTMRLAELHVGQGAYETAVAELSPLTHSASASVAARAGISMAEALIRSGHLDAGLQALRDAAAADDIAADDARERLAWALFTAGRNDEAHEAAKPLLAHADSRLCAHANYVVAETLMAHDPEGAAKAYRRILSTDHDHSVVAAHLRLAQLDGEHAVEHYLAALELPFEPGAEIAAVELAQLLPGLGRRTEAIELLGRQVTIADPDGSVALRLGELLEQEGKLRRARNQYEDALLRAELAEHAPVVGVAGFAIARLAEADGDRPTRDLAYQRVLDGPTSEWAAHAGLELAADALMRGLTIEGRNLLTRVLALDQSSTHARAWLMMGALLIDEEQFDSAESALARAQAEDDGRFSVQIAAARSSMATQRGDLHAAEALLEGVGDAEPAVMAVAEVAHAELRWKAGDQRRAEASLRTVIAGGLHPATHMAQTLLAELLQEQEPDEALDLLEAAAHHQCGCAQVHQAAFFAGNERLEREQFAEAAELFELAAQSAAEDVASEACYALAALEHRRGDRARAIERLRPLADSAPEWIRDAVCSSLGLILVEAGELDEGEALLARVRETDDAALRDAAQCAYGELLLRRGELDQARRWLEEAADSDDDEIRDKALWHLGEVYSRRGEKPQAQAALETAADSNVPYIAAAASLALAQQRGRKP